MELRWSAEGGCVEIRVEEVCSVFDGCMVCAKSGSWCGKQAKLNLAKMKYTYHSYNPWRGMSRLPLR